MQRGEHSLAAMPPEAMVRMILELESELNRVRAEVDRLSLKEKIDSLAARVAALEAEFHGN